MSIGELFHRIAQKTSEAVGTPMAFVLAIAIVVLWVFSGPTFGYSDTWQLIINTGTTILTFLMVFLIQNTQNRDNKAIHLKLDELIRSMRNARNQLLDIENMSDSDIQKFHEEFMALKIGADERIQRKEEKLHKNQSQA
ncbi:MAG: hypothetical protein A2808_02515 [Candidatus Moranbacteria bacterium RIFCSPHIGHO2_01_FULL_55_24]|nr:MAG: hypothetical protein A2808_02515 [Candidatus Moranbacteria bacterium RIFCSPHIGHO2_01_FULL_55_24]